MLGNLNNLKFCSGKFKSRLKSETACYYSMRNLVSSSLLSKNLKIKIFRVIILPVVL